MVTKSAAATKVDPKVLDPKTLNFEEFIAQAKRPKPKPVSIFLRHDLFDEIEALQAEIDSIDARIKYATTGVGEVQERGVSDADPLAELEAEREQLVLRCNPLAEEFNASEVKFEFRLIERGDRLKAKAAMLADKHVPEDDEENEVFPCYMMAQTCVSVDWPGSQWLAFRDAIGEFPFLPLQAAFQDSGTAGARVSGPFSLRPSHTPISTV